jgi:beta-glucosidase-like glycosyl hydrolase/CubicO group peptidase (beta-lactamase class C family)
LACRRRALGARERRALSALRTAPHPITALLLALAVLAGLGSCRVQRPVAPPAARPAPPSPSARSEWADETLRALTLEQKAAQLIGVRAYGLYRNPSAADARELTRLVRDVGVGCVVVFESEVEALPRLLNRLQQQARIPLLIAADMERGLAFRVRRGVVPLPYAMAVGATGSVEAARFMGEVTAREGRALGIHWAFAPVADVNNNPANPIINIRSFGEDPESVSRLTAAFVLGARAGGILTTAKHFPGHGDTSVDSHLQLATVDVDPRRLRSVELLPFERVIQAGVDSIMVGHIAVPSVDPSGSPATLSPQLMGDLLRDQLGFRGLIVTDALDMSGVRAAWTGEAAVRSVQAGADLVLLPPDPDVAVRALVRAVREGQLSETRLDASVRRMLAVKDRLELPRKRLVDAEAIGKSVGRPEDHERALEIARQSITVVRNEGVLPLHAERPLRLLHLVLSSDLRNDAIQGIPEDELRRRAVRHRTIALGPEVSDETAAEIVARAGEFTHVLVSAFVRVTASKGTADMAPSHARLLARLRGGPAPLLVVSFGSPYLLRQVPDAPVYVCAYGAAESSQRAAVAALFGEYATSGRLPVTIPGLYARGDGLTIPRHEMKLRTAAPESVGFRPGSMAEVERVVEQFVERKAFPGGVLAVGKDGALVDLKAFGRLSYEASATPVSVDTIYDLASLTKVVVTTTMAMILVDEGKLDLSKPVSAFVPQFRGGDKDRVTVWHLLTHSSGLPGVAPVYKEGLKGREAYLARVLGMPLQYEPGTKSVYSDPGPILLGEILERVAGEPIEAFVSRRIFEPLGMRDTMYRPPRELLARVAPTENDADYRGRMIHGEVHDENAWALGGVAPHAGLFGTASDLARFAQMLLNGGIYDHHRIVSREVVERFTRRAGVPDSTRALGWDTPSAEGSSAGVLFSSRSFGHTGFTGTSMWIDPEKQLFVILLTNRVHPTRENRLIMQARPAVADAVVRGLISP